MEVRTFPAIPQLRILSIPGLRDVARGTDDTSVVLTDVGYVEIRENRFTIHRLSDPRNPVEGDASEEDLALLHKLVEEGTLKGEPDEKWKALMDDVAKADALHAS